MACALAVTAAVAPLASAATWVGNTDTKWNTNSNWASPAAAPLDSSKIAIFNQASTFTNPLIGTQVTVIGAIQFTGNTVGNIEIASDPAGQNGGAVTFQTNGTTVNGTAGIGILIDNTSSGALTLSTTAVKLGGSQSWINNSANTFTVNSPANLNGTTLTVAGSGATKLNGNITNSTGTGALTKDGSGTLMLGGGTISYNGATTVSNGSLLVTGTMSNSSAVVTANGGTLGGTGTIGRATTINSGATIAPGVDSNTAGTLKIEQNLTLGGTATFDLVSASNADSILVNGSNATGKTLSVGGSLSVAAVPGFHFANGQVFDLFDWGAKTTVTGTFSTIQLPALGSGLSWKTYGTGQTFDYATGQISVVPEPASLAWIGLVGAAGLLRRRRAV